MTTVAPKERRHEHVAAAMARTERLRHDRRVHDLGLLVIRVALAWDFVYHGAGKLLGAFGGPGLHATAVYFAATAHLRPGLFFAVLGSLIELLGGIAMALGALSRLWGVLLLGDMVIAMITVTWANGINADAVHPGYELNLALAALAAAVALLGAGRVSVDHLVGAGLRRRRATAPRAAERRTVAG